MSALGQEKWFPPIPTFLLPRHASVGMCKGLPGNTTRSTLGTSKVLLCCQHWTQRVWGVDGAGLLENLGWLLSCLSALPGVESCPNCCDMGEVGQGIY